MIDRHENELARLRSRKAVRALASSKSGKKLLRAVNGLRFVEKHDTDKAIAKMAGEAADALAGKLAKRFGTTPGNLAPVAAQDSDKTEELPFDGA